MHEPGASGPVRRAEENNAAFRRAGTPGGGGYATARAMAAFYHMLAAGGSLGGRRLLSPRMVQYVTRSVTSDRVDGYMGMPMHRGLGPHLRGTTDTIRGLGALASPRTFGHGGVGSSYCWGDPDSGVSFAYLTKLGYYDGLSFHRVITGFMAQGGCPMGTGTGGPGYEFGGEFSVVPQHARIVQRRWRK